MEKASAAAPLLELALRQYFCSVLKEPLPAKLAELVGHLCAREETQKRDDHTPNRNIRPIALIGNANDSSDWPCKTRWAG